jgi:hypothetical protein
MKAEAINLYSTIAPEIRITNKDEEVRFYASTFGRKSFKDFDVFDQINQYWASLPEPNQDAIFEAYKEVYQCFNLFFDRAELDYNVTKKASALLDLHNFDSLYHWLIFKSNIIIPESFDKEYIESIDNAGSREQTYIRSDYMKLAALSLILRTMVPVWGEYINATKDETGNDWKEYYAFQLISQAKLLNCDAFDKLRIYIDYNIRNEVISPNKIVIGSISSEDFPLWLLALICVRKLCVGNITGVDNKAHLVSFIFQYISQKTRGADSNGENKIKNKIHESKNESEPQNKLSRLESYKLKQNISMGEIVELEYSVKDLRRCAYRLSANMNDEILDSCLNSAKILNTQRLSDPQINLLRWIFTAIISPNGIMYLSKEKIVDALGVAQAVLWTKNHHLLSLLITSFAVKDNEIQVISTDRKDKINKDLTTELDRLYPYFKLFGGKKSANKPTNQAVKAIDNLVEELSSNTWIMTADDRYINMVFNKYNDRRLVIPYDIKNLLASLVVELGNRK